MSEHTEGRIEAFTEPEFSGWWALREITDDGVNHEVGSGDGGLFEPDARRLAAAWNFVEGMATEDILEAPLLTEIRDEINELAAELNAARALLREVLENGVWCSDAGENYDDAVELEARIGSYLDACDTLEGK